MIRKKSSVKEETLTKQDNKQTDIKENNENQEPDGKTVTEEAPQGQSIEEVPEQKEQEIPVSDKTGSRDMSLEEKLAEMQDKYIRLSAEFDNYRKRTLREKMDLSKYAGENLLLRLLPFMDDFERAIMHMDNSTDAGAVKEGINLIYMKFSDFLKQNGVREIESLNQAFNVDIHEAVAKVEVEDDGKKGRVIDVVLKGYYLQDKVLRYSKVVVGE